jgi:DNA-binding transcriptional regulator YhcF (GntR family)
MLAIDPQDPTPPYGQVRVQIMVAVRSGALAPGAKLPTVRKLAEDLGLAVNTVAKAYRELEREEVIETRGRNGTFVSPNGDPTERQAQLAAAAYRGRIEELGIEPARGIALIKAVFGAQ